MKVKDLVNIIIIKDSLSFEVYTEGGAKVLWAGDASELEPYLEEDISKLDICCYEITIYLK